MPNNSKPFDIAEQQPGPRDIRTPDVTISGATIDRMINHLSNPIALIKGSDGNMHPLIEPSFVIGILVEAARQEAQRQGILPIDTGQAAAAPPN